MLLATGDVVTEHSSDMGDRADRAGLMIWIPTGVPV